MPQLGWFNFLLQDAAGNALAGVNIEVRKQAAMVNGAQSVTSGQNITVYHPGGLTTGDTVQLNAGATAYTATVINATTIQLSGFSGSLALVDGDHIHASTPLVTAYQNPTATGSAITFPLQTDASGKARCSTVCAPCTIYMSGGGMPAPDIRYDEVPTGFESESSEVFTTGSAVAYDRNTRRALAAGDKHTRFRVAGVEVANVGYDGTISSAAGASFGGSVTAVGGTFSGNISAVDGTFSGTLAVSGASTLAALSAAAGAFSGLISGSAGLTISAGSISLPAGAVAGAALAANAVSATYISTGTTDQDLTNNGTYVAVVGDGPGTVVAVTMTPASTASEIIVMAVGVGTPPGGASIGLQLRVKNGSTVIHEALQYSSAGAATLGITATCYARQTGLTGAQTYSVEAAGSASAGGHTLLNSSSTDHKVKLIVIEHKK